MISATDFLKSNPIPEKKRSKLFPFKDEIAQLRAAGASFAYIQEYLKANGIDISIVNLRKFILTHLTDTSKKTPLPPHEKLKQTKLNEPMPTPTQEKEGTNETKKEPSLFDNYKPPKWAGDVDVRKLVFSDEK